MRILPLVSLLVPALLSLVFGVSPAFGQVEQGGILQGTLQVSTTNYRFAEPNELTIVVSIVGGVQRPGRYEVSRSINLIDLISLAGGPTPTGSLGNVKISRVGEYGPSGGRKEIRVDLADAAKVRESDLALTQGDFVFVDASSGVTVQEVLSAITTAAVLTTAVVTVINQTK
jgi:NADH:ubiquinone oxidoreductase subunit F (NADH-binding)